MIRPQLRPTRRLALTAIGAAGASITAGRAAAASSGGQADFEGAVEALRLAMVAGDGPALDRMLHERLIYMHSSGHSQTKQNLLRDLVGRRFFSSLTYDDPVFDLVDGVGVAAMTIDQVKNLRAGKTRASRIKVMQTWVSVGGEWKLLARLSSILPAPQSAPESVDKG